MCQLAPGGRRSLDQVATTETLGWRGTNRTQNRKLNNIEVELFKPSVEMLLNDKNGMIVVDDEMLASRA